MSKGHESASQGLSVVKSREFFEQIMNWSDTETKPALRTPEVVEAYIVEFSQRLAEIPETLQRFYWDRLPHTFRLQLRPNGERTNFPSSTIIRS
jgi:hypothetical protein